MSDPNFKFELGDEVKDTITGFSGIVYARIEWFNGCLRYSIMSTKLDDKKTPVEHSFDQEQLLLIKAKKKAPVEKEFRTGGPYPSVSRPSVRR